MQRVTYPYTTVSTGLSVFDRDNQYRPLQWLDASSEIDWLNREDNGLLLTILERLPSLTNEFNNPVINWTEETRTEVHTTVSAALGIAATTLTLADPHIAVADSYLFFPDDGEIVSVTSITDYAAGTMVVVRGVNGTAATAKVIGDNVIAMPAYMAELDVPKDGIGRTPGESQYNCISLVSNKFSVSKLQENSMMFDSWGQIPKAQIDTILDMRRMLSYALLFQARATRNDAGTSSQIYISQGALHYNKDGFLDLGTTANNMTWPVMNDWLESRFRPDASSQDKFLLAGQTLFGTGQKMMRDLGRLGTGEPYFEPSLKTMAYQIRTDEGFMVNVLLDKYGLNVDYGLGSWGFLFDMAHIMGAHYNGLDFQWFQNIQANDAVMTREDAFVGSFSLIMKHQATHGVIRGGAGQIVNR